MRFGRLSAVVGLVLAHAFAPVAGAQTITFDGYENDIFGDEFTGNGTSTGTHSGFTFTSSVDHFHFIDCCSVVSNGTSNLLMDRDGTVTMTQTGGGLFDLLGLLAYGYDQPATALTITGFFGAGGSITNTFAGLNASSFTSISLAGYNGLSSVVFDGVGGGGQFGLENISVAPSTTVPEPATMTLLGFGLAGVAFARRKRRAN